MANRTGNSGRKKRTNIEAQFGKNTLLPGSGILPPKGMRLVRIIEMLEEIEQDRLLTATFTDATRDERETARAELVIAQKLKRIALDALRKIRAGAKHKSG